MNPKALKVLYVFIGLSVLLGATVAYGIWSESQKPLCDTPDIKGNISLTTHEKIYHVPSGNSYDRTIISPEAGEKWFCSVEDAEYAGWRRAER